MYASPMVLLITIDGTLIKTGGTSNYSRLCIFTTGGIFSCNRWYFLLEEVVCLFIKCGKLNYSKW